tara:strand:- start:1618 stop:2745 length:1128 start_codon:yes stop_codon:yes gene_type:complete
MSKNKNIVYVFGFGRKNRLNNKENTAKEFFYGWHYIKNKFENSAIIEMKHPDENNFLFQNILNYLDKVLRKMTRLPIYTKDIINFANFRLLKDCQKILFTTDLLIISFLPLLLISKIFSKKEVYVIVMGLFGRESGSKTINFFQNLYIKLVVSQTDRFIFLGKPEKINAVEKFPNMHKKFTFLPFSIDYDFWNNFEDISYEKRDGILFIGNDGKREYDKVVEIAKRLPDINFTFISSNINVSELKNINVVKGNWNNNYLSDEQIRDYYLASKITFLPIKNSLQPSGQSVTLQSLACGTPVIISHTDGFWDESYFQNNKNIIFNYEESVDSWISLINKTYYNDDLIKEISKNGKATIKKQYNLDMFHKNLENIIGI